MFKPLIFVATFLLPSVCLAQITFSFTSRKSGHQTGPKSIEYTGGDLQIFHRDGSVTLSGCAHPSATRIFPNPLGCPLGTTGYLAIGDLDGDDVRDDGSFWSLAQAPIPSALTLPFHPVGLRVESAPPSLFIRPGILPVNDGSVAIWYNVLDALNQLQYDLAAYTYFQDFDATPKGRSDHDKTVTTGTYKFSIPWLGDPQGQIRQVIGLNKLSMPESYPGLTQSPLKWGFRFTNNTWDGNGRLQFDPRLFNDITWDGFTSGQDIFASLDSMRLWMLATPSASPFDLPPVMVDPNAVYPPGAGAILFPNSTVKSYRLPALFFEPGDTATLYLRLDRSHPTGVAIDESVRVWTVNLAFIDTYAGFSRLNGAFPPGTSDKERGPNYDFDGDGVSNLIEFALNTDPADPASNPTTAGAIEPFINDDDQCEVTVLKRPNIGTSLRYELEYSPDMVTWTKITADNPDWVIVTDDETEITVRSVNVIPEGSCFIRAQITALN